MKIADGIFYVGVNDRKIDLSRGSTLCRKEWRITLT